MRALKIFILLLSAAGAYAAAPGVIFRDDFSSNRNGWNEVFGLKDLKAIIEDGKFRVKNNLMQTYLSKEGLLTGRRNFEIEAVFSDFRSEGNDSYGLKFGTADQRNWYAFTVNRRGEAFFSSMLDGNRIPSGPPKKADHLKAGANVLTVKCYGGILDMLVNGRLVDASECANAPWDRAGFIVGGKIEVNVDDYTVREPTPPDEPDGARPKKKVRKKRKKKPVPAPPEEGGPESEAPAGGLSLKDMPGMQPRPGELPDEEPAAVKPAEDPSPDKKSPPKKVKRKKILPKDGTKSGGE